MLPCIALSERDLHTYKPINAKQSVTELTEGWDQSQLYVGTAKYKNSVTGPGLLAYEQGQWVIFPRTYRGEYSFPIDGVGNVVFARKDIAQTQKIVQDFFPEWKMWEPHLATKLRSMGVTVP